MEVLIIADDRERYIQDLDATITCMRLEEGDFRLISGTRVFACIERKSLPDFSASFKDGRYAGEREKMLKYRTQTGCKLIFLVEGGDTLPTEKIDGIPYKTIEAAMSSLCMKHGISSFRTKDKADTLRWLRQFQQTCIKILEEEHIAKLEESAYRTLDEGQSRGAYRTLDEGQSRSTNVSDVGEGKSNIEPVIVGGAIDDENPADPQIFEFEAAPMDGITRESLDNAISMLTSLGGVSRGLAKWFLTKFSIAELLGGQCPDDVINHLTYPATGRSISRRLKDSLKSLKTNKTVFNEMIFQISGFSRGATSELTKNVNIPLLLRDNTESKKLIKTIADVVYGTRKIGPAKAKALVDAMCSKAIAPILT